MSNKNVSYSWYGIFVWILATLFFLYEYFLRALVGSISFALMRDIHLTTEQFSLIGSAYYIAYAGMQIPVGILVDRFGVKYLLTLAAGFCTLGIFWFAFVHSFGPAFIARFMIGLGSSFAFVSLLVISSNWFSSKHFGFLSGMIQFLGGLGPLLAGAPFVFLVNRSGGWRIALLYIACFGVLITLFILLFIKEKPEGCKKRVLLLDPHQSLTAKLRKILVNTQVWSVGAYTATNYASIILLGAFWGTTFLRIKGLPHTKAALIASMVWLGMAVGSPLFGKASDYFKRRKFFLILASFCGLVGTSAILYLNFSNQIFLSIAFFLTGCAGAGQALAFPTVAEHFSPKFKGAVMGFNNTACMIFGAFIPLLVSSIVQTLSLLEGSQTLTYTAFVQGLSIMPIFFIISILIAIFGIKETFGRQQGIQILSVNRS